MIEVKEHDVVRLKDGREGTVIHVFSSPRMAYLIETDEENTDDWPTVEPKDIEKVIWKDNWKPPS